mmetsp:Transcript_99222/g.191673  ORF Transcript_99222/g.191673 Transcript_99222/m.191673 type:complete len:637 (+) Transcript_99222:75-1985(+)
MKPLSEGLPAMDPWVQYLEGDPWDDCRDLVQASLVDWRDDFLRLQRSQASAKAAQALLKARWMNPLVTECCDKSVTRHFEAVSLPGTSSSLSHTVAAIEEEDAKASLPPASLASLSTSPSSPSMQLRSVSPTMRVPSHRSAANSGHSSSASPPSVDQNSISPTHRHFLAGSPMHRRGMRHGRRPEERSPERRESVEDEPETMKAESFGSSGFSAVLAPVSERLSMGDPHYHLNRAKQLLQEQRPAGWPLSADMQGEQTKSACDHIASPLSRIHNSKKHEWRSKTAPTSPTTGWRQMRLREGMVNGTVASQQKGAASGHPVQIPKTACPPPRTAVVSPAGSCNSPQSRQSPSLFSRPCGGSDNTAGTIFARRQTTLPLNGAASAHRSSLTSPVALQAPRRASSPSHPPALQVPQLAGVPSCIDAPRSAETEIRGSARDQRDLHQDLQPRQTVPTINTDDSPSQAMSHAGSARSPTLQIRSLKLEKSADLKATENGANSVRSTADTSRSSAMMKLERSMDLNGASSFRSSADTSRSSATVQLQRQQSQQQQQVQLQLQMPRSLEKLVDQKVTESGGCSVHSGAGASLISAAGSSVRSDAGASPSSATQQQQQQHQQEQQCQQQHSTRFVRVGFLVPDW